MTDPRQWISTQHSGPPLDLIVSARGSRGLRRGNFRKERPAGAGFMWPPAGRLISTRFQVQVVDGMDEAAPGGEDSGAGAVSSSRGMPARVAQPAGGMGGS